MHNISLFKSHFRFTTLAGSLKLCEVILESLPQMCTQWYFLTYNTKQTPIIVFISIATSTFALAWAVVSYVKNKRPHWFHPNHPEHASTILIFLYALTGIVGATMQFRFLHDSILVFHISIMAWVFYSIITLCLKPYRILKTSCYRAIRNIVPLMAVGLALISLIICWDTLKDQGGMCQDVQVPFQMSSLKQIRAVWAFHGVLVCCLLHLALGFFLLPFNHAKPILFAPLVSFFNAVLARAKKCWQGIRKTKKGDTVEYCGGQIEFRAGNDSNVPQIKTEIPENQTQLNSS